MVMRGFNYWVVWCYGALVPEEHKQLEALFLSMQSADPRLRILQENLKITDGRANFFDTPLDT